MTIPFDRPLSDEEFILLGELLAGIPEPYEPMEADHLDGYLTALVCLPKRPPVGEWMLRVFDVRSRPEAVLADRRAQQDLEDLVFRRFNSIERDLKAGSTRSSTSPTRTTSSRRIPSPHSPPSRPASGRSWTVGRACAKKTTKRSPPH